MDDANLASSLKQLLLGPWRQIWSPGPVRLSAGLTAQQYAVYPQYDTPTAPVQQPVVSGYAALFFCPMLHIVAADVAVPGMTTKLRIVADTIVNATAPGRSFTFDLKAITALAGSGLQMTRTLGSSVGTLTVSAPSASVATRSQGAEFTLPAAGTYMMVVTPSGTLAANSETVIHTAVEMHHV